MHGFARTNAFMEDLVNQNQLGFRSLGFRGLGSRGLGYWGLGFRVINP